jgi:hypothetical protein
MQHGVQSVARQQVHRQTREVAHQPVLHTFNIEHTGRLVTEGNVNTNL